MVALELKQWQDKNALYVELSGEVSGIYTTYTKDFELGYDLQEAINFCLMQFNNANNTNFVLAS